MDVLSDLLRAVRLGGAVLFRGDFSSPWAVAASDSEQLARVLLRVAPPIVMFHGILGGTCWVQIDGGSREALHAGDVVVLPFGDAHLMGAGEAARVVTCADIIPGPPPWPQPPHVVAGGAGECTRLVCGFLQLDTSIFNRLVSSLPRLVIGRPDASPSGRLLRTSLEFLGRELEGGSPGGDSVSARLTEVVFVEVIRRHLARLPEHELGWLSALRDPGIRRSLELMHAEPARAWTVDALARRAAMSRSAFAARFTELVGQSPAQYLTRWRLQLASQRLRDSSDSIAEIAAQVGYGSETALSRAFKREVGHAPAHFRRDGGPGASGKPSGGSIMPKLHADP